MAYKADGTTVFFEGSGTWRLVGDRLTETLVEVDLITGDPEDVRDVGKPHTTRIRRVGPHEGAMRSDDGWLPMLRCRPGDIR